MGTQAPRIPELCGSALTQLAACGLSKEEKNTKPKTHGPSGILTGWWG